MKRNIINLSVVFLAFAIGFWVSRLSSTQTSVSVQPRPAVKLDSKNWAEAVALPGSYAMPVSRLLYSSEKPTKNNLLGDGFCAYVVSVENNDMRWFLDNLTGSIREWWKGTFELGHMDAYVWVMGWMRDADKAEFAEVVDIDALIKKPNIVHRQEVKRNSSGHISNVRMWIIDPDENIVVFLNEDT